MKASFGRKRRWITWAITIFFVLFILLFVCAIISFICVQVLIHDAGPSAEEAFRRYIKSPIPESVTDLRIHYVPHMRGYWLYLVFDVSPDDLDSLFNLQQSNGAVPYMVVDGVRRCVTINYRN